MKYFFFKYINIIHYVICLKIFSLINIKFLKEQMLINHTKIKKIKNIIIFRHNINKKHDFLKIKSKKSIFDNFRQR